MRAPANLIDSTSSLDLTDNALVLPSSAFSSIDDLRALVLAGRGGADFGNATWNGLGGIASSAAAADQFAYALGYARNDLLPLGAISSIYGQTLASNDYIVRFTHAADATLDGVVDDDETAIVGAFYDGGATSGHQWYEGDFDYDATVDDDDVTLLGSATSGPVTSPLSPPPADAAAAVRDDFYYNESWQLLQTDRSLAGGTSQPYERYAYDPRYIDAPILRDRDLDADGEIDPSDADERIYLTQDANFNTTAGVDVAGDVVERYHYTDPYGKHVVLDGDWGADADGVSDIEATNLYAGYVFDGETGMYLARHRFYLPSLGIWNRRDPMGYGDGMNVGEYVGGAPTQKLDFSGFSIFIDCPIDDYLRQKGVSFAPPKREQGFYEYNDSHAGYTAHFFPLFASSEILAKMIRSPRTFWVRGDGAGSLQHLKDHVDARIYTLLYAMFIPFKFGSGADTTVNPEIFGSAGGTAKLLPGVKLSEAVDDMFKVHPKLYHLGCFACSTFSMYAGMKDVVGTKHFDKETGPNGDARIAVDKKVTDNDWIPGYIGWIANRNFKMPKGGSDGLEGENIMYFGGNVWWGMFGSTEPYKALQGKGGWMETVREWKQEESGMNGDPALSS